MNSSLKNKIKHFPQLFALGQEIPLTRKWYNIFPWSTKILQKHNIFLGDKNLFWGNDDNLLFLKHCYPIHDESWRAEIFSSLF